MANVEDRAPLTGAIADNVGLAIYNPAGAPGERFTLTPWSNAKVYLKGDKGDTGSTGPTGPAGPASTVPGPQGPPGNDAEELPGTDFWIRDTETEILSALSIASYDDQTKEGPVTPANGIQLIEGRHRVSGGYLYISIPPGNRAVRFKLLDADDVTSGGGGTTLAPSVKRLMAKMAAGEAVIFAAFGDEPDGAQTGSWTANPTSGSDPDGLGLIPTGTAAHATAASAWPSKLQAQLRTMYVNNNISVWNAGYNGQRMDNGWAMRYYDKAVTNNPGYGVPDVCFIQFGVNDIVDAGGQYQNHYIQTKLLVAKLIAAGTIPVLVASSPIYMTAFAPDPDTRDHRELNAQINAVKQAVAHEMGVMYIDVHTEMRDFYERNNESWRWTSNQTNRFQFGNNGHNLISNYISALLFEDTIWVDDMNTIPVFNTDSRGRTYANSNAYVISGSRQGGTATVNSGRFVGERETAYLWIYNRLRNASLHHRSTNNSGVSTRSASDTTEVRERINGTVIYSGKMDNSGAPNQASAFQFVDRAAYVCQLVYGLQNVTQKAPTITSNNFYPGYFEVVPNAKIGKRAQNQAAYNPSINALKETGALFYQAAASSGVTMIDGGENSDLSNVIAFGNENKPVTLLLEIQLDPGMGLPILCGKGYGVSAPKNVCGLLYRQSSSVMRLYQASITSANVPTLTQVGADMSYSATGLQRIRIDFSRNANGNQDITIYSDWTGTTTLLASSQPTIILPWSGFIGSLYSDATNHGAGTRTIHVNQANIIYK